MPLIRPVHANLLLEMVVIELCVSSPFSSLHESTSYI